MAEGSDQRGLGKIADLIGEVKQREIPMVSEGATVGDIVDAFVRSDHSRILYVVDEENRLIGVISLGNLVRHVFFLYHGPQIDSRHIISMGVSETAEHFMQREPLFTGVSEDLEEVLQRMMKHNVKEIAVVDDEKRLVADLTMVDLLKHYKSVKGTDL